MQKVVLWFIQQAHEYFVTRPVHKNLAAIVVSSHYPATKSE
jgi:hypothetical protein